ncbi:MAG: 50S ribosomal protein L29 [Candidatus Bathyarchaeia archaeon]
MPLLRMKEIREMKPEERIKKLRELKVELSKLKTTVESGGTVENPARIREIKRTIARILTVQWEEKKK